MEDDCKILQELSEKLGASDLQSQLIMNDITTEDLCNITSTLNNILTNLFENPKFSSICELEESLEAAAKKYNIVFERITETQKELNSAKPPLSKRKKKNPVKIEKVDFWKTSSLINQQKESEIAEIKNHLLRKSKEAEDLNNLLSKELATSKEELFKISERTSVLGKKIHSIKEREDNKENLSPKKYPVLKSVLSELNEEKDTLIKEQSELENFMEEIEIEIKMKEEELNRMKNSLDNEQKILSASKNTISEMITAQAIGALSRKANFTPLPFKVSSVSKEGDDICMVAKLTSESKDIPMSSFSMRFSSIENASCENNSSIGPCIKRITFSSTAKKPEIRASAENNNETNHNILVGLSCEKDSRVNISEFAEKEEASEIIEPKKFDEPLKKEKHCLCTIF